MFKKIKNIAKKIVGKSGDPEILSLDEILNLSYVKDVMKESEVANIRASYDIASDELRKSFSAKLMKMNKIYVAVTSEQDPVKQKMLLLNALNDGLNEVNQTGIVMQKQARREIEQLETEKAMNDVENKLIKI